MLKLLVDGLATSILGKIERMIGSSKCGLQVAEKCIDDAELWQFDACRAAAGNGGVICGTSGGDSLKARQPVADDLGRGAQRLAGPVGDGVLGEFEFLQARQLRVTSAVSLDRSDEGDLVFGAAPALAKLFAISS